jgi:hypothetical protein
MIETVPRGQERRLVAEMPLADVSGRIALGLQCFGDGDFSRGQAAFRVRKQHAAMPAHAAANREPPREQGRAARRAHLGCGIEIGKPQALGRHQVEVLGIRRFESLAAGRAVVVRGVGSVHFHAKVVALELQNAQTVECPGEGFGAHGSLGSRNGLKKLGQAQVEGLYRVGPLLVQCVDAAFDVHQLVGGHVAAANFVLEVPLYGINPRLGVPGLVHGPGLVGRRTRSVPSVAHVVVFDGRLKQRKNAVERHLAPLNV